MAVPTLVQATGSALNDNNGIKTGNGYVFNLPNLTLAGNCLVLAIAYPYSAARTVSIVDSTGDTWPAATVTTGTASSGNMNTKIFVLQNASAGLHTLTVTFDTGLFPFQYTMAEFYNVATASAADGSVGANSVAGSAANAGSFTPSTNNDANGGHLIFQYAISNDTIGTLAVNQASAITATNSAKFLHANNICTIPNASAYYVQATNGATNPGFVFTQSTPTNFVVSAVALKAASAGQAPAAGIRIVRMMHYTVEHPNVGDNIMMFPCDGNLRLATMAAGSDLNPINSVTDSDGHSYNARSTASQPQFFDFGNTALNNALTLTMNFANAYQASIHLWDITGADASPFMNVSGIYTSAPASGTVCNDLPDHTPNANVRGLTICQTGFGTAGPVVGTFAAGAPAGAITDIVYYTNMTDSDQMDNADPFGHVYFTSNAAQTWNWLISSAAYNSTAFATAGSYKSGPVSNPSTPIQILGMASSEW